MFGKIDPQSQARVPCIIEGDCIGNIYVRHCVLDFIAMRGRHVCVTNLHYSRGATCLMIAIDIIHDDHAGLAIARACPFRTVCLSVGIR